jgi:chromosome segregation ATPase
MRTIVFLLVVSIAGLTSAIAEEAGAVEAQLRDALRNTMLQLREAQAKTAEMEAASVQAEMAAEKAKKETAAVQAQLVEERSTAANQTTELRAAMAQVEDKAIALNAQVAKWEKDYRALTERTRKSEYELAKARGRNTVLERTVAEQQVKLTEMKNIADEILDRYAAHSFGRTMLAREPFISVNRASLQTIMQDLETRLRAANLPGAPQTPAPASAAATPAPSNR